MSWGRGHIPRLLRRCAMASLAPVTSSRPYAEMFWDPRAAASIKGPLRMGVCDRWLWLRLTVHTPANLAHFGEHGLVSDDFLSCGDELIPGLRGQDGTIEP